MMKRICCIVLLLLPFSLFAQYEVDGIGFIDLKIHGKEMYELDLYLAPQEEITGCLTKGYYKRYFTPMIIDNQDNQERITRKNTSMIVIGWGKYYGLSLQYYDEKNGFVKVRINKAYHWINLDQLLKQGGSLVSWKSYFPNIDLNQMQVFYTMNLRAAPTANSDKIMVVRKVMERRGFHIVEMTGKFEGNWAEVNIHIWENGDTYCGREKGDLRIAKGWMKYLDDEGFPNLFPIDFRCC